MTTVMDKGSEQQKQRRDAVTVGKKGRKDEVDVEDRREICRKKASTCVGREWVSRGRIGLKTVHVSERSRKKQKRHKRESENIQDRKRRRVERSRETLSRKYLFQP